MLDKIRDFFRYDPETGDLFYTSNNKKVNISPNSYGMIMINLRNHSLGISSIAAHNLVWWLQTGEKPKVSSVRAVNKDFTDLRWKNLQKRVKTVPKKSLGSLDSEKIMTLEDILSLVTYVPDTGEFYWKRRFSGSREDKIFNSQFSGKKCGYKCGNGYIKITFLNKYRIYSHRLVWFVETGEWPDEYIDHIDHDRSNNTFTNLRQATHLENCRNRSAYPISTTGYTGVSERGEKYIASLTFNYKRHYIGIYKSVEEAVQARVDYIKKHGMNFHDNHGKGA